MIVFILKWISQGLIAFSGIAGLVSEAYKTDPVTGKRSLTRAGKIAGATFVVSFAVFLVTDIKERADNAQKDNKPVA
jgi:hypothetical protein